MPEINGVTTTDPYEIPPDLTATVKEWNLSDNIRQLVDEGYTVIQDEVSVGLTDEIRNRIVEQVDKDPIAEIQFRTNMLELNPVFSEAVTHPATLAVVDFLLGRCPQLSQMAGSVRRAGTNMLGLHSDSDWFPAPFPKWEIMATACWVCDEFTEDNGATMVIPGSHIHKCPPPLSIVESKEGMRPVIVPKGSIVIWNGSVWHGGLARKTPGRRVVLHMTYSRLGMQPIESHDHLEDGWFVNKPSELRSLLGREHFFGRSPTLKHDDSFALKEKTIQDVYRSQEVRDWLSGEPETT